jgi:hypothetical protein
MPSWRKGRDTVSHLQAAPLAPAASANRRPESHILSNFRPTATIPRNEPVEFPFDDIVHMYTIWQNQAVMSRFVVLKRPKSRNDTGDLLTSGVDLRFRQCGR